MYSGSICKLWCVKLDNSTLEFLLYFDIYLCSKLGFFIVILIYDICSLALHYLTFVV